MTWSGSPRRQRIWQTLRPPRPLELRSPSAAPSPGTRSRLTSGSHDLPDRVQTSGGVQGCRFGCVTCDHVRPPEMTTIKPSATRYVTKRTTSKTFTYHGYVSRWLDISDSVWSVCPSSCRPLPGRSLVVSASSSSEAGRHTCPCQLCEAQC